MLTSKTSTFQRHGVIVSVLIEQISDRRGLCRMNHIVMEFGVLYFGTSRT
jgi:hypothetical protein